MLSLFKSDFCSVQDEMIHTSTTKFTVCTTDGILLPPSVQFSSLVCLHTLHYIFCDLQILLILMTQLVKALRMAKISVLFRLYTSFVMWDGINIASSVVWEEPKTCSPEQKVHHLLSDLSPLSHAPEVNTVVDP